MVEKFNNQTLTVLLKSIENKVDQLDRKADQIDRKVVKLSDAHTYLMSYSEDKWNRLEQLEKELEEFKTEENIKAAAYDKIKESKFMAFLLDFKPNMPEIIKWFLIIGAFVTALLSNNSVLISDIVGKIKI